MAHIAIKRTHALTIDKAKKAAQKTADKLAKEYDLESEWEGNTLRFHRAGVEGHLKVTAKQVAIDVELGFLLSPFRGSFEEHIRRHLDETLG